MNTSTLTNTEQRGLITFLNGFGTHTTYEGHFYLEGNTVIMRRLGGRNHFRLCSESAVHDFAPAE